MERRTGFFRPSAARSPPLTFETSGMLGGRGALRMTRNRAVRRPASDQWMPRGAVGVPALDDGLRIRFLPAAAPLLGEPGWRGRATCRSEPRRIRPPTSTGRAVTTTTIIITTTATRTGARRPTSGASPRSSATIRVPAAAARNTRNATHRTAEARAGLGGERELDSNPAMPAPAQARGPISGSTVQRRMTRRAG